MYLYTTNLPRTSLKCLAICHTSEVQGGRLFHMARHLMRKPRPPKFIVVCGMKSDLWTTEYTELTTETQLLPVIATAASSDGQISCQYTSPHKGCSEIRMMQKTTNEIKKLFPSGNNSIHTDRSSVAALHAIADRIHEQCCLQASHTSS